MNQAQIKKVLRKPIPYAVLVLCILLSQYITKSGISDNQITSNQADEKFATVDRVVDGDTIEINQKEKVRLIGIDTPESVDPRKPVQCMGKEAASYLKSILVSGTSVRLISDPTQTDRDKYNRLLRYVYIGTSTDMINLKMVAEGYAREYTYNKPYIFQTEFKAAERKAEQSNLGLWNPNNCPSTNHV